LLFEHLTQTRGLDAQAATEALLADYQASGARGKPRCLAAGLQQGAASNLQGAPRAQRQARHGQQKAQAHPQPTEKAALL
jgi:hypothetical protein